MLLLASLIVVAACGNGSTTASPLSSALGADSSGVPTESGGPAASSSEPSSGPSGESPSPGGTAAPASSPGAAASGSPNSGTANATACTGSAENRDFFASMAAAVDWPVYCPVLPDGWFVESGQYRLANGGRLEIVYRGPDRAKVTLDEGAFCTIQGGCVPPGQDVGPTAFDGGDGLLVALDDGSWAIALDREASLSWLLIVTGLDEATARAIAAALVVVEG